MILEVKPANKRKSLRNPKLPQWHDLQAVFKELGGIDETTAHELSGPFIRRILEAAQELGPPELNGGERVTTKLDLLRYGARLWQTAYPNSRGDNGRSVVTNVDAWCNKQPQTSDWRSLTLVNRILPELCDPSVGAYSAVRFDEEGRICLHPERVSRAWVARHHDSRDKEIGGADNVKRELEALKKAGHATYGRVVKMAGNNAKVWTLSMVASTHVMVAGGLEGLLEGSDD